MNDIELATPFTFHTVDDEDNLGELFDEDNLLGELFDEDNLGELLGDMRKEDDMFFHQHMQGLYTKTPLSNCSENAANTIIPSFANPSHSTVDSCTPTNTESLLLTYSDNEANTSIPTFPKSSTSAYPPLSSLKREPEPNKRKLYENAETDSSCYITDSCSVTDSSCSITDSSCSTSMGSSASNEIINNNFYVQLEDNDVLMGRGGHSNGHPGNQRYRQCILGYQRDYKTQGLHGKRALVQAVVDWVELQGGRFLASKKSPEGHIRYYVASDKKVYDKVSNALREDHTPEGRAMKKSRLTHQK